MLVRVYTCQNVKLLEITCRGSFIYTCNHFPDQKVRNFNAPYIFNCNLRNQSMDSSRLKDEAFACAVYGFPSYFDV